MNKRGNKNHPFCLPHLSLVLPWICQFHGTVVLYHEDPGGGKETFKQDTFSMQTSIHFKWGVLESLFNTSSFMPLLAYIYEFYHIN